MGLPDDLTLAKTLSSGSDAAAPAPSDELPLVPPEAYRIAGEIAHGGGGRILRAFDLRLQRWVALKLPLERGGEAARRFRNEARVTARLEHPGIVPVHEAGRWPDGEPFYAMKLVSGRSLGEVVTATRTLDERLALLPHLAAVAEAMAYAHTQQVIHRDLKPSNIMVGSFGEAIIIDWGLSKDLRSTAADSPARGELPESPTATASDAVLGTPAYMAPEQAEGPGVDVRADVYALGAVLYAVLSGHAPYEGSSSHEVLDKLKRGAAMPLRVREPEVPEDLATIVDKAMRRDRAERYSDAAELAAELRRFQTGQMVRARHYSAPVRFGRWLKRHRIIAAAALAVVVTVAVSFERVVRARNLAEARQDQLILAQARSSLAKDPTLAVAWARSYRGRGGADRPALDAIAAEAQSLGVARSVWADCARAVLAPDGKTVACIDHGRLVVRRPGETARRLAGGDAVRVVRWLPDGGLVSLGEDGDIRRWDGDRARIVGRLGEPGRALQVGADGSLAAGGDKGALLVVRSSGETVSPPRRHAEVVSAEVSPDGRFLATTDDDRVARLWRIGDPAARELPEPPQMKAVVFSPDGKLLAWGSSDGGVRVEDLESGRVRVLRGHQYNVARVAFSPDSRTLASTGQDKTVRLWDLASGEARILTLSDIAWRVVFSPDGKLLVAVTDQSAEQRVIDLRTLDVTALRGHRSPLERVQFSRDSRSLLTSATDGETRLWPVAPASERVLAGHTSPYAGLAMRADGTLVSVAPDGVRIWDPAHDTVVVHPSPMPEGSSFTLSENGEHVVWMSPELHYLEVATGRSRLLSKERYINAADAQKGRLFLAAEESGGLRLFDLVAGTERPIARLPASPWSLQGTSDGAHWAVGCDDGIVRLVEPGAGVRLELRGHSPKIRDVNFSHDGRLLASGATDPVVRVWDVATGEKLRELVGHESSIEQVRFSPVEELLASTSLDATIRLWNLTSGESHVLRSGVVQGQIAFSGDGRRLYSGGADGVVREWDVDRATLRRVLRGHEGEIEALLAPRGAAWVASYADDHTLRLWPPGSERAPLLWELTTAALSRDEHPLSPE